MLQCPHCTAIADTVGMRQGDFIHLCEDCGEISRLLFDTGGNSSLRLMYVADVHFERRHIQQDVRQAIRDVRRDIDMRERIAIVRRQKTEAAKV